MGDFAHIRVDDRGGVVVVHLLDDQLSDLIIHDELRKDFDKVISDLKPTKLLVNFSVVTFTSTGSIEVLLRLRRQVHEYDGQVKLCGMTSLVRQSFRVLNLDGKVFEIYDTEDEGVASFEA